MRAAQSLRVLAACAILAPASPVAAAPEGLAPLWKIPLESLEASQGRPLMSPSRRPKPPPVAPPPPPPPPPVVAAPPPEPEPMRATLLGVVLNSDETALAILIDDSDQSVKRIRVGEGFAGWTLTAVRRREVDFLRGSETMTLPLPAPSAGGAGNPAVAALSRPPGVPGQPFPGQPFPGKSTFQPPGGPAGKQMAVKPIVPTPMPAPPGTANSIVSPPAPSPSRPPGMFPGAQIPPPANMFPMPSPMPAGGNIGMPPPGGVPGMFKQQGQDNRP